MPTLPTLLAYIGATVLIVAVPGPGVLFMVGRSLALGYRGGMLSMLGNALGLLPPLIAVILGLGAFLASVPEALVVVKLLGACYLVWMGVQTIRQRRLGTTDDVAETAMPSTRRLLIEGFLVGATNPKPLVFFLAVIPQFVEVGRGPAWQQMLVLGAVFMIIALIGDSSWTLAAAAARSWMLQRPERLTQIRSVGGALLIILGVILAVSGISIPESASAAH